MPGALLVTVHVLASQSALGAIDEQSRTARPFSKSWAVPVPSPKKKSVCWKPRVSLKALPAALHTYAVAAVSFTPSFSAWVLVDDPPCAIELIRIPPQRPRERSPNRRTTDKVDESIGQGFERFGGYASCVLAADAPLSHPPHRTATSAASACDG